jgi:hypothetical protein
MKAYVACFNFDLALKLDKLERASTARLAPIPSFWARLACWIQAWPSAS